MVKKDLLTLKDNLKFGVKDIVEDFISWQGEGEFMGQLMYFIRFAKCKRPGEKPLCSFCDTQKRTCKIKSYTLSPEKIFSNLKQTRGNLLITGGEPSLYIQEIEKIFKYYGYLGFDSNECFNKVLIETNGYDGNFLDMLNDHLSQDHYSYILCPKIFDLEDLKIYISKLKNIVSKTNSYTIKILISSNEEKNKLSLAFLEHVLSITKKSNIWLMPLGVTVDEINPSLKVLIPIAKKYRVNISSRLHTIHNFE